MDARAAGDKRATPHADAVCTLDAAPDVHGETAAGDCAAGGYSAAARDSPSDSDDATNGDTDAAGGIYHIHASAVRT